MLLCFVIIVLGGVIFHELGLKFMSPTINLWMKPKDFIKYCSNLKHYSQCKLEFLDSSLYLSASEKYPVACLDDIIIYFLIMLRRRMQDKNGKSVQIASIMTMFDVSCQNVTAVLMMIWRTFLSCLILQHHWFIVLFLVFPIRAIYEDLKTRYN